MGSSPRVWVGALEAAAGTAVRVRQITATRAIGVMDGAIGLLGRTTLAFAIVGVMAWGALALWFKLSERRLLTLIGVATWMLIAACAEVAVWTRFYVGGAVAFALIFAGVLVWWIRLRPSNDRVWNDDVARMTTASVDRSIVSLSNLRDFTWRSRTDYDARWVARSYDLERLRTLDMILSYWAGPAIAHTLVSFGFDVGDGSVEQVVFTVEIRRRRGQLFSEIGGFFKMYELSIVAATERDALRVRTNVRGEDDYLFRVRMQPAQMRSLFLAYVDAANRLVTTPRFYNTITANCTTIIYQMVARIVGRLPLSYRLLLSGYLPEYVHAIGGLDQRHTVSELRECGRFTERARAADQSPAFSAEIRRGIPELG